MKSTFVAMTSHEFRNPLAAILSSQELLRDYSDRLPAPSRRELFTVIDSSVHRMTAMLDKLLIVGRADADLLEFRPIAINIADICRKVINETLQSSQALNICSVNVRLHLELEGNETVYADENLLRHCLENLLSNALKYSPEGSEVVLSVRRSPISIVLEVMDQGIGIPEKDIPRLFEAFHRASNVGTIPGTGLGLAIVKQSVERHGGTIVVSSELAPSSARGTRFTVELPQKS